MAAMETVNSRKNDVEAIVNRWLVDYYSSLALELYEKEQYADFCAIRRVLDSVMVRPFEATDVMEAKMRVLDFLCCINQGESLDASSESDQSISPLESALVLLKRINQEVSIPKQDFENVCTSLKEMMVANFIKNNKFDKAKEVLNKHFPKPVVGKKAIFMGLIRQKSKRHEVIEQIDFQRFKEEMLAFCQRLFPVNVPFLHKAAKMFIDKRLTEPDDMTAGLNVQEDEPVSDEEDEPDLNEEDEPGLNEEDEPGLNEHDEPGPSSSQQINIVQFVGCKHKIIQRIKLEATYKTLCADSLEITFAQLDEEVEREEQAKEALSLRLSPTPTKGTNQDSEQNGIFQRDSGSPMEASPADQQPQTDDVPQIQAGSLPKTPSVTRNRRLYTVAQLVVEPDSQGGSQCTTKELETEVRTEEPPQSPAIPNEKDLQNPLTDNEDTTPTPKRSRRIKKICSRASTSLAESSADSEEDSSSSVDKRETRVGKLHNQSNSSLSRNSTKSNQSSSDSEEDLQEPQTPCKTPVQKPRKQLASKSPNKDPSNTGDVSITDSSLDSSPTLFTRHPVPQTSSTPQKISAQEKEPSRSKWKKLLNDAKESKDTWSDEESYFPSRKNNRLHNESTISNSGHRKRRWTESETQKLRDGVKKFGEGNWSKIKAYYSFKDRTNVNLKDRWRTMKKLKMV